MSRIEDAIKQHRAQLLARERTAAMEMTRTWMQVRATLLGRLHTLQAQMAAAEQSGQPVKVSWLHQEGRLRSLLDQTQAQVDGFAAMARGTVTQQQAQAAQEGARDGASLLRDIVPQGVSWTFTRLSTEAVDAFIGAAGNGSPLSTLFDGFGAEASAAVRQTLVSGVASGQNPRVIASQIAQDLAISLHRALTISRTETLRAYRGASLANYRANADVVSQWRWVAAKSINTCAMCLAMDGTLHDLDEDLDSHPNCRCTPVPLTRSWSDILGEVGADASGLDETSAAQEDYQSGADWLDEQDAATQRAVIGTDAGYAAYRDGDVTLDDFIGVSEDSDWGTSRYQKSLKQLGIAS